MSPEEATKTILEGIELDPEQYRLGNTKVYV
jgi:myosin heavy chain 6/7